MAENDNRNTENFVLGLIVAAIVYFIFRRQLDRALGIPSSRGIGAGATPGGGGGGCGCGCPAGQPEPENPGVSVGNQSYNSGADAFGSASLAAVPAKPRTGGAIFSGRTA